MVCYINLYRFFPSHIISTCQVIYLNERKCLRLLYSWDSWNMSNCTIATFADNTSIVATATSNSEINKQFIKSRPKKLNGESNSMKKNRRTLISLTKRLICLNGVKIPSANTAKTSIEISETKQLYPLLSSLLLLLLL